MHGLLGALLNFAILVVLYIVNMNLLAEWWVGTLAMGIFVVVMCTGSVATVSYTHLTLPTIYSV